MRKSYYILLFLLITLIQTNSCKKIDLGTYKFNPKILGASIKTSVKGIIVDEFGNQVSGALITAGTQTVTSDIAGVFILENIDAYEKMGYIKVEKQGFFTGSRSFVPSSGGSNVVVRLLSNKPVGSIKAETGGKITAEGVEVSFSPGTIVKNNIPYAGSVNVSIQHIDPTSKNFEQEMPGNLFGLRDDNLMGLTSFGMVGVELKDDSGQPLQIAEGKKATVIFPIPRTLVSTAPQTIDLWSFDEENGFWVNEGKAQKQNDKYVAEVGHFSFWNCDVPWKQVNLEGKILISGTDLPIQGAKVIITSALFGSATALTNNQGVFGGIIPMGENLKIEVRLSCNNSSETTVYTGNIGPFSSDATLANILIDPRNFATISGTVIDCNNTPSANGYVVVNGKIYFTSNGKFSISSCSSAITIIPYSFFPSTSGTPQTFLLNRGTLNIGNIQTCSVLGSGIVNDVDGNTYATVKIGTQEWMAENLKTSRYRNGDPIPTNVDSITALHSTIGYWYYYDNDSAKYDVPFGKLYNWYAAVDSRGVCPTGWHVPSQSEWQSMINYLGGYSLAGTQLISKGDIDSKTGFWSFDLNLEGTNSTGFSAQPGGLGGAIKYIDPYKFIFEIGFVGLHDYGLWWSSSERKLSNGTVNAESYVMINDGSPLIYEQGFYKFDMLSIRCIKD